MPQYKTHVAGAFLFFMATIFVLSLQHYSLPVLVECFLCTLLGGLFPDIDIKSKGQKIFYYIFGAAILLLLYNGAIYTVALMSVLSLLPILARHRGIFHNMSFIIFVVVIAIALLSRCYPLYTMFFVRDGLFFLLGIFSHLVLDRGFRKTLDRF